MLERRKSDIAESAVLVGLYAEPDPEAPDRMLDELASLVEAAGGTAVARMYQRRRVRLERDSALARPLCSATYIGRGKAGQVAEIVSAHEATLVAFDNELTPAQIRELEQLIGCRVIDRSELILDIFANRARTREAKLQVELAQLQYTAPRLRGMWTHLERQANAGAAGGGIGTRGPGEKQIEMDRRIIGVRIDRVRSELKRIDKRRERTAQKRVSSCFSVGLVGYTNAGKSTLMNALTNAQAAAADRLFETLDTRTRRWTVEPGVQTTLSDTVGFVRDLPHQLVASFRATLTETLHADLLLHVIDASHPQAFAQIDVVNAVLTELGVKTPTLYVLNKVDAMKDPDDLTVLRARLGDSVVVSAKTGEGLKELAHEVALRRRADWLSVRVRASAGDGKLQSMARSLCHIESERYEDAEWVAELHVPKAVLSRLLDASPTAQVETSE